MTAAAGIGGAMVGAEKREALCAEKLGFYQQDSQRTRDSADDNY
jgi:hypothetical protein